MGHKIYETVSWYYNIFPTGWSLLKMDEYIKPACWEFNMEQEKKRSFVLSTVPQECASYLNDK